jgi:SAM-dependent methyltransferase
MSDIFGKYAQYYDLLYKDKNYLGEVDFIEKMLRKHAPTTVDVLELGCGTGTHAIHLAKMGYKIHGIDLSESMIDVARQRAATLPSGLNKNLKFSRGNACDCNVDNLFDAVLSLFHVVSYQSTNNDLIALFKNAANHLKPGGVFIFDYWFGPAVLTDLPAVRVKRLESDAMRITRLSEPEINVQTSCVDVKYQVMICDKATQVVSEITETHRMRYLFLTEIELLARLTGLVVEVTGEWMTDRIPNQDTWGVYSVLRK